MTARAKRLLPVALLVSACASTPPFTAADREAVASEIRSTLAELTEAMNDHDPERVVAFYSDAPEFLFLGCTSAITGGARFKQIVVPTYGPGRGATFVQRVARVQVLSPTAAVALQRGSSSRAPALFWTRVLVKEDGRWVITYEHQSWPGCDPPPAPHRFTAQDDSAAGRDVERVP
jgi:ketosteroid isomerase-like protein